jgi:hypothetical protein
MSRRQVSVLLAVASSALVVGLLAWFAGQPSASGARQLTASSSSAAAASPGPRDNFGFSKAVQARVDSLNAELDQCLLGNGAKRIPLERGWTYTDPGGRPSAACTDAQARVNSYANSEEYRQAVAAVLPAVQAYSECLQDNGVAQASHGVATAAEKAAVARAHLACGGSEEDIAAAG